MKVFKSKNCSICNKEYSPTAGIQKVCIDCRGDYRNKKKLTWYHENKERDRVNKKEWYLNNLEKVRNTKRKWNNSEKGRLYRREYYLNNKELVHNRLKKYKYKTESRIKANRIIEKLGWERICSNCQSNIKVQIDHIDGDPFNNTIPNLQMLCLSCHSEKHHRKRLELDQSHAYQ